MFDTSWLFLYFQNASFLDDTWLLPVSKITFSITFGR